MTSPTHHRDDSDPTPPIEPESQNWRAWLLGAFFSITVIFGGAAFHALDARLTTLEEFGSPPFRERIAAMEARQTSLQREMDSQTQAIRDTMKRIEDKLDLALERLHQRELGR